MTYISKAGIALCVTGSVIFLISFLGCCGAWKNVRCLLALYAIVMLILLIVEIGIGVLVGAFTPTIKTYIAPNLVLTIQYGYMGDMSNKTIVSIAWDAVMYNVNMVLNLSPLPLVCLLQFTLSSFF